jgi:hypothetical protein
MIARLISDEKTRFGGMKLDEYFARLGADRPDHIVDLLIDLLIAAPLPANSRDGLIEICRMNPNKARSCAETIHALTTLPEFQLS